MQNMTIKLISYYVIMLYKQVDLCLACMNMDVIPDDLDLSDNTLLKGMEVTDVRSLNGNYSYQVQYKVVL